MTEYNDLSILIRVTDNKNENLIQELTEVLTRYRAYFNLSVFESVDDNGEEENYFPVRLARWADDYPGEMVGRGRVVDTEDLGIIEVEFYDKEVITTLRTCDIDQLSIREFDFTIRNIEGLDDSDD